MNSIHKIFSEFKKWFYKTSISSLILISSLLGAVIFIATAVNLRNISPDEAALPILLFTLVLMVAFPSVAIIIRGEFPWFTGKSIKGVIPKVIGWLIVAPFFLLVLYLCSLLFVPK